MTSPDANFQTITFREWLIGQALSNPAIFIGGSVGSTSAAETAVNQAAERAIDLADRALDRIQRIDSIMSQGRRR